jgi:pimeloyl-ACP methyl ester carboxylesterase
MRGSKMRRWLLGVLAPCVALPVAGLCYEALCEARDAARIPAPGKLVDVGGYRLHLLCKGDARGPSVIMVAGGGTPAVVSYPLQDRIAKFARVCSYDRAGLGWSDPAPHPLTFAEQTAALETLLHAAHVPGPYVFVPESFGSLLVIDFARRHPEQVAGIAFLDGAEPRLWFDAMPDQSRAIDDARGHLMQAAWHLGLVRLALPFLAPGWVAKLPSPTREELIAVYSRPAPGYAEALEAYRLTPLPERPGLAAGALGDRPVIVVRHGKTSSALSPEFEAGWKAGSERLAKLSIAGIVVTAGDADHEIAQENPDLAARAVKEVVEKSGVSAKQKTGDPGRN